MRDLKKIHIVFLNCDVIEILRDDIYSFGAGLITETITLYVNTCITSKVADEIVLTLNWDRTKNLRTGDHERLDRSLSEMLDHKKITSYHLYFNDGSELSLLVPWKSEEQEEENLDQDNDAETHERWSDDRERELMSIIHKRTK